MVLVGVLVISGYWFLRNQEKGKEPKLTEVNRLIEKDLEVNYPSTPNKVLKMYSRIVKCFYNEELKEEEQDALTDQIMYLYDDQLLEKNPKDKYLERFQGDALDFKASKKTMMDPIIQKNSQISYYTKDGKEYATVLVSFMIKEKVDYSKVYEQFVLRKDSEDRWKMLGWKAIEATDFEGE